MIKKSSCAVMWETKTLTENECVKSSAVKGDLNANGSWGVLNVFCKVVQPFALV